MLTYTDNKVVFTLHREYSSNYFVEIIVKVILVVAPATTKNKIKFC